MNEPLLVGLIVSAFLAFAIGARMRSGEHDARALSRLEAKLDALLAHEGIRFDLMRTPPWCARGAAPREEDRSDQRVPGGHGRRA